MGKNIWASSLLYILASSPDLIIAGHLTHVPLLANGVIWSVKQVLHRSVVSHVNVKVPLRVYTIFKAKAKVTLRLTVNQSVRLVVEPLLVLMTRCLLLFNDYCCFFVGCSLWREVGSVDLYTILNWETVFKRSLLCPKRLYIREEHVSWDERLFSPIEF
jgi:hypothetical protein